MEELFKEVAGHIGLVIEAVAIVVIAIGTIEAIGSVLAIAFRRMRIAEAREAWMRYARWLVAGLTFQLAGDIVHTAIAPTWDDIGRLAAIAVIRTFLAFFLDRDMEERRLWRKEESAEEKA